MSHSTPISWCRYWISALCWIIFSGLANAAYPVIFVHGIWSDASTWQVMASQVRGPSEKIGGRLRALPVVNGLESCRHSYNIYEEPTQVVPTDLSDIATATRNYLSESRYFAIDFTSSSDLSFSAQAGELKTVINCVLSLTQQTKVILVGHSMGGIASRHYLQNLGARPYENDVAALVTIGTPHSGSNWWTRPGGSWGVSSVIGALWNAARQLIPGSCALRIMNESLRSNRAQLAADCAFSGASNLPAISYVSIIGYDFDLNTGDTDDGIVGVASQNMELAVGSSAFSGGATHSWRRVAVAECFNPYDKSTYITALVHICETSDPDVIARVREKIAAVAEPVVAVAKTEQFSNLTTSGALVYASYTFSGLTSASVGIEWGSDGTSFPNRLVSVAPPPIKSTRISRQIAGVSSGQTVYYRAIVTSGALTQVGDTKSFVVPATVTAFLPAPSLTTPTSGAVNQPEQPTLAWTPVTNATSYRVFVALNASDLTTDPSISTCNACVAATVSISPSIQLDAGRLVAGRTYFWRVHARNPDRYGEWSSAGSFTVAPSVGTLGVPSVTSPQASATATGANLNLNWTTVTGATSYRLVIAQSLASLPAEIDSSACLNCVWNTIVTETGVRVPDGVLQVPGTYFIKVKARNLAQYGQWSQIVQFSTHNPSVTAPPTAITITAFSDDGGMGTANGGGVFIAGSTFTVVASPLSGYLFDGWYENAVRISTDASYSASATQSRSLIAKFRNFFDYTLVAVIASPSNCGAFNGGGYYPFNAAQDSAGIYTTAQITAVPRVGCSFLGWFNNGSLVTSNPFLEVRTVGYARQYTAVFTLSLSLSVPAQPRVAFGQMGIVAVDPLSRIWGWGANPVGSLDPSVSGAIPYPKILANTRAIAGTVGVAVTDNAFALASNGKAYEWGISNRSNGVCGVGSVTGGISTIPGQDFVRIVSTDWEAAFGIKANGDVWMWGSDFWFSSASNTERACLPPTQIIGLSNMVAVGANGPCHAALKSDGTVWTWGAGDAGARGCLGDGSTDIRRFPNGAYDFSPRQIPFLSQITQVSCSPNHCLAVRQDGALFAWGTNTYGQLGDATRSIRYAPIQVPGISGVSSASAYGWDNSLAVLADGAMFVWGRWENGRLGTGGTVDALAPARVVALTDVVEAFGAGGRAIALKRDGSLSAWGYNADAGLGVGDTLDHPTPVPVLCGAFGSTPFNLFTEGCPVIWTLTTQAGIGTLSRIPDKPTYFDLEAVTLQALPPEGWRFAGFTGGTTATTSPAIVSMTANKTVTATFTPCTQNSTFTGSPISAFGGSGVISVQTQDGCFWRARSTSDWLTTPNSGAVSGSATLQPYAQPNPTAQPRQTQVTIGSSPVSVPQAPRLTGCALDIDGNGKIDLLTDGAMLVRHILGLSGSAVTVSAMGAAPASGSLVRPTAVDVNAHLQYLRGLGVLDVDGNGLGCAVGFG